MGPKLGGGGALFKNPNDIGVVSPFFSTIVLFENQPFSPGF